MLRKVIVGRSHHALVASRYTLVLLDVTFRKLITSASQAECVPYQFACSCFCLFKTSKIHERILMIISKEYVYVHTPAASGSRRLRCLDLFSLGIFFQAPLPWQVSNQTNVAINYSNYI